MRLSDLLQNRLIRLLGLLMLLSATVLAALWQQTSASGDELPAAGVSSREATPAATAAPGPDSLSAVVNKRRALPLDYEPTGLVAPDIPLRYAPTAEQSRLRTEAAGALERMVAAAARDGANLMLISGYRSAAYQSGLYDTTARAQGRFIADQAVARPGHSEHQTGLAADLGRPDRQCDIEACFGNTPEGRWLAANAHIFGFIVSYSETKHDLFGYEYEPWHVRFVGLSLAKHLQATDLTLEEYYSLPFAPTY